jgi:hypothetical protein
LRFAFLTVRDRAWMPAGGRRMFSMSAGPAVARVARSRATASRARSWSITTVSCHAISCLSSAKLGGCPPSGGGGRSGRRALRETAPAFLCRGSAGGLGARSSDALGPMDGPIANLTVGFFRLLPAGAGQGNPKPDGSAARRMRASVHMTWPLQSRRTRAGMVDTPNRVTHQCLAQSSCRRCMRYSCPSGHCIKIPHGVRLRGVPEDKNDGGVAVTSKQSHE